MGIEKIKILVIDDNADNLTSVKALIKEAFPDSLILTALNGTIGIEMASLDPDLILLDILMPGMDGFEVCRSLKSNKNLSDIPVVFFTALKGDRESRIQALECGAEAFIAKPIDETELTAQIRAMVKIKTANIGKRDENKRLAALVEEQTHQLKNDYIATLNILEDLKLENEARRKSEEKLLIVNEKLKIKEAQYKQAFDLIESIQTGLHIYHLENTSDDKTLRLVYANPASARMTGVAVEDVIKKTLDENFPYLRLKGIPQQYAEVVRTKKPIQIDSIYYGDERVMEGYFLINAFPLPDNHVGVAFENITEKKKAEIELIKSNLKIEDSEKRYRSLFNNMTEGFALHELVFNEKGKPIDYRFLDVNPVFEQLTGLNREEIIGKGQHEVLPDEDPYWFETYCKVAQTGKSIRLEYYSPPLQKHYEVYAYRPTYNQFAVVFIDITKRIKAQELLKQSEEKYRNIIETTSEGFLLCDKYGKFIEANPAYCELSGYTQEELLTMSISDVEVIESKIDIDSHLKKIIESGKDRFNTIHKRKDGSLFSVEISTSYFPLYENRFVVFIHDISDRMEAEDKIKSLLAEKEIILKEVHHRIKNNMSIVNSLLFLQAQTLTEPTAIAALEDAGNRVKSMTVLYNKLYQSSNFLEIPIGNYLPSLIDEIIKNFPNKKSIRIEKNIEDFIIDGKRIQTLGIIINELLTNIMKYAFIDRNDGLIIVEVGLHHATTEMSEIISIVIHDNGNGMPETIDFENSPGFGLMLVNMLTKQLNGTIRIERKNGTRIILEFEK
jgi:PAS domain S-box-containing protein